LAKTWGYVLAAPNRPLLKKQIEALKALGVDVSPFGFCWQDKVSAVKRGPGPKDTELQGRNDLLNAVASGDRVIVADPYCVGLTREDAAKFIAALAVRGVSLLVSGETFDVPAGGDPLPLLAAVERAQNTTYVRRYRETKPKRKRKS
jgi:hypothetical protein